MTKKKNLHNIFARHSRALAFDPDPQGLLETIERTGVALRAGAPEAPSQAFRVLRPDDLVVFDVRGYGLEYLREAAGAFLAPAQKGARLEIVLPFQHLGERAFLRSNPPPGPNPGDQPLDPPPVEALAAQASRLVFDVPEGERIAYTVAGVLGAMTRLPLRVAPLATPNPATAEAGDATPFLKLTGGLTLARDASGALTLLRKENATRASKPSTRSLVTQSLALRAARAALADETALDLSPQASGRAAAAKRAASGPGRRIADRLSIPPVFKPPTGRPRPPRADETAIEAPFRLILSPSALGGFAHATAPVGAGGDLSRIELWHMRLGVRGKSGVDESRHPQRIVRAIWTRDMAADGPDVIPPNADDPFRMSLNPHYRALLVRQSADSKAAPVQPIQTDRLHLSALGAYLGLHGRWPKSLSLTAWDHEAPMGRDQYVRVVVPGYFFPFGHRCAFVTVTERRIPDASKPIAYLYQRMFIEIGQPVRTYDDRRMPFRQISILPLVTPDIRDPNSVPLHVLQGRSLFWPVVGNDKFSFTLDCVDWSGRRARLQAPLIFVAADLQIGAASLQTAYAAGDANMIRANAQSIAFAESATPGDVAFESVSLRFNGVPGAKGSVTATPFLDEADIVVPAMRHLAPAAPATAVKFAKPYLDSGFSGANAEPQVVFELKSPVSISFGDRTDRAGGFVKPDLPVRGLSRTLGTVGDIDSIVNGPPAQRFDPKKYLANVFPKLFGLFDLVDILEPAGLDGAPKFVTEQLDRIAALLSDLDALKSVLSRSVDRLANDAANGATKKLRDQAKKARARLDDARAKIEPQVAELLKWLATPTGDPAAALSGPLAAIAVEVAALRSDLSTQAFPSQVKAEIERLVDALDPALGAADLIAAITNFVNGLDPEGLGVRARYDWTPKLNNYRRKPGEEPLFVVREDGFRLSVEARASGRDGVGVDALAELRGFKLNLFPTAPLMRLAFDRLSFRAASGRKPEVDVVFLGIEFLGVLGFIETLKNLIPFDSFSDPPYVDVSSEGVRAGFSLALPSVAIGVFALDNISLGADVRVPFLGKEALTIGFNFCTREKPFHLTVMMIGGGGFVGIRLSPRGLVVLEMALEAGACLSLNFGVASGSVSVMIGVYLRLEADAGCLTGYFRIRGEVDVLGLISASITLELSLTYEFNSGKMVGRASIEIEVEVFLLSFSVTVSCERRLAGANGDPTFEQVMLLPDNSSPAWSAYCAAFAEA